MATPVQFMTGTHSRYGSGRDITCSRCNSAARPHRSGLCSGCQRRAGMKVKGLSPWEKAQAGLSKGRAPTQRTDHDGKQRQARRLFEGGG